MRFLTRALVVLAAFLTALGSLAWAGEPIRIGVVKPLTGPVAYDGTTYVNTLKMLVEDLNAKGGVLGRPIQIVVEDGACIPAQSVNAAEKLIVREKVPVLIGAFCSTSTGAVMEVARKYKVPHITGVSTAASLTEQGNPYFFRAVATTAMMANAFGPEIVTVTRGKRFAFLVINDDWGRTVASAYPKALERAGAQTVGIEFFQQSDLQFLPLITKIKGLRPDAIMLAGNTQHAAALSKQIRELGIPAQLFGEGAWASDSYLKLAGETSEGVHGLVMYVHTIPGEVNAAFVKEFQARFKDNPTLFAGGAHNVIHIVADAIKRANSTAPEEIREALERTDYRGLVGNIRFDEKHQAYGQTVYMAQIRNKVPVVVKAAQVAKP